MCSSERSFCSLNEASFLRRKLCIIKKPISTHFKASHCVAGMFDQRNELLRSPAPVSGALRGMKRLIGGSHGVFR